MSSDTLKVRLVNWWNALLPEQRKKIVLVGICTGAFILVILGWAQSRGRVKEQLANANRDETRKEIKLEPGLMEKTKVINSEVENERLRAQIEAMKAGKPYEENNPFAIQPEQSTSTTFGPSSNLPIPGTGPGNQSTKMQPVDERHLAASLGKGTGKSGAGASALGQLPPLPPAPASGAKYSAPYVPPPPLPPGSPAAPVEPEYREMGKIAVVSFDGKASSGSAKDSGKKKEKGMTSVYIPPSYMEATLLSGAYIPTAESAKGHPMPVLLRIKTPAFLPNEAKAAVKGCFIIADGKANLATERAEMTLVSISCLDKKGQAVIDQKVKGWLIDSDGIAGLQGKVVAKMGAMVARSLIANFFGGMGDALKQSATTQSISALGTTTTIDSDKIGIAGIGSGLGGGFKDIQKFYLDLAKQTLPAIAVLPSKSVTVAISEGSMLEIKPINGTGRGGKL